MKDEIQIAYLIIAHNQPQHLSRMVNALNHNNAHFFIHIDGKSDISEFLSYSYPVNTHFLKKRFHLYHEGFSIVEAMILLIKEAFKNPAIDYFAFLSGWDYPIKSNAYILDFLKENYPKNFISYYPLIKDADYKGNVHKYYFIDSIAHLPKVLQGPLKLIMENAPIYRPFLPGLIPYRGSAWSCIGRISISYILDALETEEGKRLKNFYKYSFCADEMFFHTLLLNSSHAHLCQGYEELSRQLAQSQTLKNENKTYLHYIDWDKSRENPALLDLSDYEKLMESEALFARKFHEEKSAELLSEIDEYLKENERSLITQRAY